MKILAYNAGYHGTAVLLQDGKLQVCLEEVAGLDRDWILQWKVCGLFLDGFMPLCTNDSGIGLGAAINGLKVASSR